MANLLSRCGDFDLNRKQALAEIAALLDRFDGWESLFRDAGVPNRDLDGYRVTFTVATDMRLDVERERKNR